MSNSNATSSGGLVVYTKLSPNCNKPRNHKIDTITIHHMAGTGSIETCGLIFADPNRKGSSNYGIGSDGRIALYVEEANRAWASSNAANDHRAITITASLKLVKSFSYETNFSSSYFTSTSYIHSLIDEKDNVFIWKTTTALDESKTYNITGTIKDHSEYNGVKQTVITRCKIKNNEQA